VILQEEAEEEQASKREESYAQRFMPQEVYLSKQEKEMLLSNPKDRAARAEDEEVFNTVLQEYFS